MTLTARVLSLYVYVYSQMLSKQMKIYLNAHMDYGTICMTIIKIGAVKELFHEVGFTRVSRKSITALDKAISSVLREIAKDTAKVYGKGQVESKELAQLTEIKDYVIRAVWNEPDDLDIKELLKEEQMPEGWDKDEDEGEVTEEGDSSSDEGDQPSD